MSGQTRLGREDVGRHPVSPLCLNMSQSLENYEAAQLDKNRRNVKTPARDMVLGNI